MFEKLTTDALMLWATIDPVGTLALFAALTAGLSAAERKRTAFKAIGYASLILIGSVVVGELILSGLGIRLISLQIAGGIILFLFGLQMVFGKSFKEESGKPEAGHDIAVFPLAIPSIASPGAIMAAILLTDNHRYSVPTQIGTSVVMLAILAVTYLMMVWSNAILKIIGTNGASVLVRVMGMILAALSVELIMEGLGIQRWIGNGP